MMQEKQLYGYLQVYRERGRFLRRREMLDQAKAAYDTAYINYPEDVRLLVSRSQVCADIVNPHQAYADAELALKQDPHNMVAKNMQAQAMYSITDFERSLVMNFRGFRQRKKPPYFKEGINQGLQTVEDCIGQIAGPIMLDFLPLISQLEDKKGFMAHVQPVHVSRIPKPEKKKRITQMQARKHLTLSRVMAMKYLGAMAYDKFFLQELTQTPCVESANASGSKELQSLIQRSLCSLTERQEMLRAQRPYYSVIEAEKAVSNQQNKWKEAVLEKEREIGALSAERFLKQIDKCLRENQVMDVISNAERMQLFLDMKTPRTLPDKNLYIDRLYRAVGEAYLAQHRLSYTLSERGNRRRIAFLMGLPIGRPKSFDSVMANYPYKFVDINYATERVSSSLEMCENSTMRCWLMYEMARLLCTQKNYALAKFYAKRCQREAKELNSPIWWLNGLFALMMGDMQQGNANEVRIAVEEAYEYTKKLPNPERLQAFLKKCEQISAQAAGADERKVIAQREKQVLSVMEGPTLVETGVLFKRMSRVPVGRRFSVVPARSSGLDTKAERKRRKQPGLTVVPGPEKALPATPRSTTLGFQVFDI